MILQPSTPGDSWNPDNRRAARRINIPMDVRYCVSESESRNALALNVSATGARVLLRGASTVGKMMTLDLGREVSVLARTVWEQPLGRSCRIAGVAFVDGGPRYRETIKDLLTRLEQ